MNKIVQHRISESSSQLVKRMQYIIRDYEKNTLNLIYDPIARLVNDLQKNGFQYMQGGVWRDLDGSGHITRSFTAKYRGLCVFASSKGEKERILLILRYVDKGAVQGYTVTTEIKKDNVIFDHPEEAMRAFLEEARKTKLMRNVDPIPADTTK